MKWVRLGISLLLTGCAFYWDGPAEVHRHSGGVIVCTRLQAASARYLTCKLNKGRTLHIEWSDIKAIRTL